LRFLALDAAGTVGLAGREPTHGVNKIRIAFLKDFPCSFVLVSLNRAYVHEHGEVLDGDNFLEGQVGFVEVVGIQLIETIET
jgi:hypothetical protein